ncbi:MAG: TylF/MycF/NovP-related O-methyltransferase [Burkholderiales bacterium]
MPAAASHRRRKTLRSLVKRGAIPLADASGSYAVQHLPEWMAKVGFDFARWRRMWTAKNPANDRSDLVRLVMFIEHAAIVEAESLPGSVAELGVYRGATAKLLHELMPGRTLWLFDTFAGFDARDLPGDPGATGGSFRFDDTSLDAVLRHIGPSTRVRACPGYFPETATAVPATERFALVHLDADLRKPTADALGFFYPRMVPGGVIIVHDYGSRAWPGVAEAVDAFFADKPESPVRIPDRSGSVVVRRAKAPVRARSAPLRPDP